MSLFDVTFGPCPEYPQRSLVLQSLVPIQGVAPAPARCREGGTLRQLGIRRLPRAYPIRLVNWFISK
jgi:hypothetical protein